jgi:exodeoxyribonuclease-5
MVFTAPTNKATKVLRKSVTTDDYKPDCRTIYSLLGLRLEANGEIKELAAPEDPLDLSRFLAVVVDEGSMINKNLMGYIADAARDQKIQFIFMGDRYQLPPVKEPTSPIWTIDADRYNLTKVMRHDNQILELVTYIRSKIGHPAPNIVIGSNNDGDEGVWNMRQVEFIQKIREYARAGHFSRPDAAKAIAWRNVTVDHLNKIIRSEIFDNTMSDWCEGDRLSMLAPAKDHEGEDIAHTDDEGVVTRVTETWHPMYEQFMCYAVDVTFDDNHTGTIWLLHPSAKAEFERECVRMAGEARSNPKLWPKFWGFKDSFHSARHGYAMTAHRAQGSTYETVFVDYRDILLNRNRNEALQCLYVAFSRAKKRAFGA